jgi:hypothetical protein
MKQKAPRKASNLKAVSYQRLAFSQHFYAAFTLLF